MAKQVSRNTALGYIAAAGYIYTYQWRGLLSLSIRGLINIGDRDEKDGARVEITERGRQYVEKHQKRQFQLAV